MVLVVSHNFESGRYETELKCNWQHSGIPSEKSATIIGANALLKGAQVVDAAIKLAPKAIMGALF